jgi:hypothetical protein
MCFLKLYFTKYNLNVYISYHNFNVQITIRSHLLSQKEEWISYIQN